MKAVLSNAQHPEYGVASIPLPITKENYDQCIKILEGFDLSQTSAKFQALAVTQDIHKMSDFINLAFCCQNVPIIQDFTDLEKIGRSCYMDRNGGMILELTSEKETVKNNKATYLYLPMSEQQIQRTMLRGGYHIGTEKAAVYTVGHGQGYLYLSGTPEACHPRYCHIFGGIHILKLERLCFVLLYPLRYNDSQIR